MSKRKREQKLGNHQCSSFRKCPRTPSYFFLQNLAKNHNMEKAITLISQLHKGTHICHVTSKQNNPMEQVFLLFPLSHTDNVSQFCILCLPQSHSDKVFRTCLGNFCEVLAFLLQKRNNKKDPSIQVGWQTQGNSMVLYNVINHKSYTKSFYLSFHLAYIIRA